MSDDGGTQGLGGMAALGRTAEHLYAHLMIFVVVTGVVTLFAMWAVRNQPAAKRPKILDFVIYCGAFSAFGIATAYFLSLGLSAASGDGNSLLESFVAPFISLLTGGVAFAASKSRQAISKNDLILGVTCFLLTCILSYETFRGQELHGQGNVLDLPSSQTPGNDSGGAEIEAPITGKAAQGGARPATPSTANESGSGLDDIEPPRR